MIPSETIMMRAENSRDEQGAQLIEKLEKYWHDFVLSFPWTIDLDGAVVASYPKLPYYEPNHAADINVDEDAATDLWERIIKHSSARGFPSIWFRVTPLTHPPSFRALLEKHGCHKDFETSVMILKRNGAINAVSRVAEIKEISEGEVSVWKMLMCDIFGVPPEWNEGFDSYMHAYRRKGARCYLAYIEGRPVGTCSLLSIDGIGGIFSVGTMEEYRKRGIGSALTARALADSVKERNAIHVLYADKGEYAEKLYRKVGFETSYTVTWYASKF